MSTYTVSSIPLAAVPGSHEGTGTFHDNNWLVTPASVPPPGNLAFFGKTVYVKTLLFAISDNVVPNWFGVAVPPGITDFTNASIFFHPTPAQAHYHDSDYPTKTGLWPQLFYYMERLGYQLDGAGRNHVLIMPFLTEAAKDCGIFPAHWQEIVSDILTGVRDDVTKTSGGPTVTPAAVIVSSYSAGMIYSDSFRRHAPGLSAVLAEVWDFDGHISTYHAMSDSLSATAGCRVIQYDQIPSNDLKSFHVPLSRWADYVQPPKSGGEVHGLIRDFMFMHASSISSVGGEIAPPTTITASHTGSQTLTGSASVTMSGAGTHTASGAGTHTASATASHTATATHSVTATHPPALPPPTAPAPAQPAPLAPVAPHTPPLSPSATPQAPAVPAVPCPPGCVEPALVGMVAATASVAQTSIVALTALRKKKEPPCVS